jgi:hypothetical protein
MIAEGRSRQLLMARNMSKFSNREKDKIRVHRFLKHKIYTIFSLVIGLN